MKTALLNLIIVLFLGINYSAPKSKKELPDAPKGYSWNDLSDINAHIIKPDGWFFNAEKSGNTFAYFVTKEDYTKDPNGMFSTGLSLNVMTNLKTTNAVDYANKFIAQLEKDNEVLFIEDYKYSPYIGKTIRLQNQTQIIQYLVFGNKKTNKLYLLYYESPIEEWEQNKEIGKTLMSYLVFDPKF